MWRFKQFKFQNSLNFVQYLNQKISRVSLAATIACFFTDEAKKRLSIFQMNHNTIIHDTKLFRQEFGTVEKERNIMEKIWRKKFLWRLFSLGHPDIFSSILVSCWSLPEKMLHCQKSRDFHALILLDPGTITIYRGSLLLYFCIGFFVK